jgi:hypothetical protein
MPTEVLGQRLTMNPYIEEDDIGSGEVKERSREDWFATVKCSLLIVYT